MSGFGVGSLVAAWLVSEVQEKRLQRVQESALLQNRFKQVQNQLTADNFQQAQQNTWLQQDAHIKALIAQQRRWEALHQALLHEAGPQTVQLQRFQLDAQTLELHGKAQDVPRMAKARARLSQLLSEPSSDTAWTLVSMVNAPGAEGVTSQAALEFVWQATWPQVGSGSVAAAPTRLAQSDVPQREKP